MHFKIVNIQHKGHNILAYIMNVAGYSAKHHFAPRLRRDFFALQNRLDQLADLIQHIAGNNQFG